MAKRNDSKNLKLNTARDAKNDEFYTRRSDIEKEMRHYRKQFCNKVILCNCDDPYENHFFKYFALNFNFLGLKKLIATCYAGSPIANTELSLFDHEPVEDKTTKSPHKIEIVEVDDYNKDGAVNLADVEYLLRNHKNTLTRLKGDGDFRSAECIELLKHVDIVVTNPPFSLFREYVAQLMEYKKNYLVIGNKNAITYREIFSFINKDRLWLGHTSPQEFLLPDGTISKQVQGLCRWFTNLDTTKRHEDLILYKKYTPQEYPKYDNYDAIDVGKVVEIPVDYEGVMGVPITFLDKYNPKQFEIVGLIAGNIKGLAGIPSKIGKDGPYINGKLKYGRILIRKRAEPQS
jgi:hypothetical protein